METDILIQNVLLKGELNVPLGVKGLIIFSYCGGSSSLNSINHLVVEKLNSAGYATLLFDLLVAEEEKWPVYEFEIGYMTERLIGVTKWCMDNEKSRGLKIGYIGINTGSAVALSAAAYWGTKISGVVSFGGRPDLAMEELDLIEAPVLLIVGGENKEMIDFNRKAYVKIGCIKKMEVVPGATHLFKEEETLEKSTTLTTNWFNRFLLDEGMKERVAAVG